MIGKNKILILGSLTFLTMLILSVIFYKERTCFIDISFHLFYILKDGNFAIQNFRFGALITQLFPLIGSKLGLPLTSIAISYSMSFIILPFLTFLLVHLGLRNSKISLAYLLFVILMTTHTFYWIQSELPQAFSFLFILLALLDNATNSDKEPSPIFWFLISILAYIACYTHPLIIFPFTFAILYYYLSYPQKRKMILSIGFIYFSFYIIKAIFFKTSYDTQAMDGVKNFISLFPDYFNLQSNKNLLKYFVYDYYFTILLMITIVVFYIKMKMHKELFLISAFFIGYCLLVNVSYPNGGDQFYLENQYLVLSFIVALPFVSDVLPDFKSIKIQYIILFVICVAGVLRIYNAHDFYSNRLEWFQNLISKTEIDENKKLIIPANKVPKDMLLMTWGSSYEFWLLSTLEKGISRSIIIEELPGEFDWAIPANKSFISKWGTFEYTDLNTKYFVFTDTTQYIKFEK